MSGRPDTRYIDNISLIYLNFLIHGCDINFSITTKFCPTSIFAQLPIFQPFNTNDILQYSPSTHFILVKTHIIIKQSLFKCEQQISFFTQYYSSRYSQCIQAMTKMKLFTNFLFRNKLQLCIIIKEQVREKELPLVILLHSDF